MKKFLALLLAAVMTFSLASFASAAPLTPPDAGEPAVDIGDTDLKYGDDALEFYLEPGDAGFAVSETSANGYPAFLNTGDYKLSVSTSSDTGDVKVSHKLYRNNDRDGVAIKVTIEPIKERFTVKDDQEWKAKIKVVQNNKDTKASIAGELEVKGTIDNTRAYDSDTYTNAAGTYVLDTEARVIDVSVFEDAEGSALSIFYPKYAIKFRKVSRQNTSLYLYAKTDVVDVDNTKAIGSVGFMPTRLKDAATITMPISADNENYYGETVYVYLVVDGKPTGTAITADVINHSYVVFNVPAGTTLGTYAAYGSQSLGEAEKPAAKTEKTNKPAIPETGA